MVKTLSVTEKALSFVMASMECSIDTKNISIEKAVHSVMYGQIDVWKILSIHTYIRVVSYAAGVEQRV